MRATRRERALRLVRRREQTNLPDQFAADLRAPEPRERGARSQDPTGERTLVERLQEAALNPSPAAAASDDPIARQLRQTPRRVSNRS
jgi:hypothetical protein